MIFSRCCIMRIWFKCNTIWISSWCSFNWNPRSLFKGYSRTTFDGIPSFRCDLTSGLWNVSYFLVVTYLLQLSSWFLDTFAHLLNQFDFGRLMTANSLMTAWQELTHSFGTIWVRNALVTAIAYLTIFGNSNQFSGPPCLGNIQYFASYSAAPIWGKLMTRCDISEVREAW